MLASYGYVTLALAFYGVADLPSLYDSFDLNYFQLAADWLLAQPQVTGDRLGLFGSSTGGKVHHSPGHQSEMSYKGDLKRCLILNQNICFLSSPL